MPNVKVTVVGGEEVRRMLRRLSPAQNQAIFRKSLTDCARLVASNARTKQIMGGGQKAKGVQIKPHPTRLTSRTGTLRRSISTNWYRKPEAIDIGSDLKYGAVHEHGYSGPVTIKEHTRKIRQAFGRRITPREVTVHAHSRIKVTYPRRPFLEPAVDDEGNRFPAIFVEHIREAERGRR